VFSLIDGPLSSQCTKYHSHFINKVTFINKEGAATPSPENLLCFHSLMVNLLDSLIKN
jgi:hypothetical protein